MSLTTSPKFLYEFGGYQLNVAEALLLRGGTPVPLPPKTFEVLTLLVRRAGTLVTRDTLMRELWPDSFVEDANIARHIWMLRQAFGADDFIETVPKRGYRFVAAVTPPADAGANAEMPGDRPADSRVYESYLRANQLSQRPSEHPGALKLYLECVAADPGFAPAWVRLGRLYRVMSKYEEDGRASHQRAVAAIERALETGPHLAAAHVQHALLEVDLGRGIDAMTRLLHQARAHPRDADVLAGLVTACRYSGLLDASIAAHRRAIEIEPLIATSVVQSYWMSGDLALALVESAKLAGGSLRAMVLALAGRDAEAIAFLKEQEARLPYPRMRQLSLTLRSALEGDRALTVATIDALLVNTTEDPEGRYFFARYLARVGEIDRANDILASAVFGGFIANRVMAWDPWLESLRPSAAFKSVQAQADARYAVAAEEFVRAGGETILGPGTAS